MVRNNSNAWKNKKIRRNKYFQTVQDEIDLHGLTKTEAKDAFENFFKNAQNNNYKKIRIITGKGLHSENSQSALNGYIKNILEKKELKFSDAKIYDGGSGAIEVSLY